MPTALITGINGQDGSYLSELLLSKGYTVWGIARETNMGNLKEIFSKLNIVYGDITDEKSVLSAVKKSKPDEIYNLAAQASVPKSILEPGFTVDVNTIGVVRILETVRRVDKKIRVFQASTCNSFGNCGVSPQNEKTVFMPTNPYAVSKLCSHYLVGYYRKKYGLYACSAILYNHESPRRIVDYVSRKITFNVAKIKLGVQKDFCLGNIDILRDWSYAGDIVEGMWMMMQQKKADDFVLGSGEGHTVREFVKEAFAVAGIKDYEKHINIDKGLQRTSDTTDLVADITKAKKEMKWKPKVGFKELVKLMVEHDIKMVQGAV